MKHLLESFDAHLRTLTHAAAITPATRRWYADQLKAIAHLAAFPADALRTHHLADVELSNGFVRALKRLYRWAAGEQLVPRDPFAKVAVPPCGRRERVLTRGELCRLYRAAPRALRLLLFVQLHTLARPGEIRGLTWGQIDLGQRLILLTSFKGQRRRRDKPRVRPIPLPRAVARLLGNLRRRSPDPSPTGRVFLSPRFGRPWTANAVRCAMRQARRRAGLDNGDEPVVCYHLRHTSATEAIRREMPIRMLAEVMGHSRTTTTERYVHLDAGDLVEAVDRLDRRRKPPSQTPASVEIAQPERS